MSQSAEGEWCCRMCGTLLGEMRGDRLFIKYRGAQFLVCGPVLAVCRRCSELNETFIGTPATPQSVINSNEKSSDQLSNSSEPSEQK
jgi:ribosome-binding protein aMBF1 (putative translation factor)